MTIFSIVSLLSLPTRISVVRKSDGEMANLLDELWPAMFSTSDSTKFLRGTGAGSRRCISTDEAPGLFQSAIINNRVDTEPDDERSCWAERIAEAKTAEMANLLKERRNLFNYQNKFVPGMLQILQRNAPFLAEVLYIYEHCEELHSALYEVSYAAEDYPEQVREQVSVIVARLLGCCYRYFSTETEVRQAWYIAQLARAVIFDHGNIEGLTTRWWYLQNLHHDIGLDIHTTEELHNKFTVIQQKQWLTTEERVLLTLWLMGRRYHYAHMGTELLKLIKDHNKAEPKDKVSCAKVEKVLACCIKANTVYEKTKNVSEDYCALTGATVRRNFNKK